MTKPDFRALCKELLQELCCCYKPWELKEGCYSDAMKRANAALAQPEPAPTDEELMELMPETMRDEFSYAAKVCSDATGGQVKPSIFRVCLNHAALEYARAALAKWGTPANTINQED
jgi:hypothetical protein